MNSSNYRQENVIKDNPIKEIIDDNGNAIIVPLVDNKFTGIGTISQTDGTTFKDFFENGKKMKNVYGITHFNDGSKEVGRYVNDKKLGVFVKILMELK